MADGTHPSPFLAGKDLLMPLAQTETAEGAQDAKASKRPTQNEPSKKRPVCRFYNTENGCRAGDSCRFQHPAPSKEAASNPSQPAQPAQPESKNPEPTKQQSPARPVMAASPTKVVARPTPKSFMDDPRAFQINQIQRRFKPAVSEQTDTTTLTFEMKPSDPDFPYDIEALECTLSVPKSYPASGKPGLTVRNKDIPRGFQLNIERGFDRIAAASPNAYLLGLMNRLDQQLEPILSGQKAETITLVSNRAPTSRPGAPEVFKSMQPTSQPAPDTRPKHTTEEIAEAKAKRQSDVRQLGSRFSKLPHYVKSPDGLTFTLPLDSPKRSTWPTSLQPLRSFQLRVPELYPLEPLEIRLFNDSVEAKALEKTLRERSISDRKATITQQVNYLSSHVKEMAAPRKADEKVDATPRHVAPPASVAQATASEKVAERTITAGTAQEYDDSHIKHIPRPPEWDTQVGSEDDSSDDSYESDSDSAEEAEEKETETQDSQPTQTSAPAERGILLSFPRLELYGIELLELTSLNLTVKCERCKETTDIEKLRSSAENSKMREANCKKCATTLAVRFRADMIHTNSVRAGYLDLDACTVVDMLPSNFAPTCSGCSTQYPAPGIVAVRGDNSIGICRECHTKMSMKILEVKFLLVSASAIRASRAPGRKKPKENLGIAAGTELPNRGRCSHYKKSYRWFRFSCCAKVYPCDRCHDEQNDHPLEHANRMICGYCSREQNYRPEDCGTCHAALTGSKGRGFWEGGKGTRDPAKMSRKDPRKFRNRNKTKHVKG